MQKTAATFQSGARFTPRRQSFWQEEARSIVQAEMARNTVGYKELSTLLTRIGEESSPEALTNRINRGTFTFAFFLQVMVTLGCKDLDLTKVSQRYEEMAEIQRKRPSSQALRARTR